MFYLVLLTPPSRLFRPRIHNGGISLVIGCYSPGSSLGQVIIHASLIDRSLQLIIRLSSMITHLRDLLLVHFDEILRVQLVPLGWENGARLFLHDNFRVDYTQE